MELLRTMGLIVGLFAAVYGVTCFVDWRYNQALVEHQVRRVPPRSYCNYNSQLEVELPRGRNKQQASVP